ncbi:MAG: hypothetical protein E2O52_07650 [Gammaproteobacteria bacterium]|nr:MAG: hypothetical protein E2O52_07650 [Gammaproteobacteria bacterium]
MMGVDAILFIGPSLPERESGEPPGFERRPPAAQGDVYRATLEKPRAIGIVDGYFHGVPAVWHKEILWAMTKGIHVFGAASMGALRAAELHPFGMRGVGRIFEAYRDGALSDDDEVALTHGPEELGYPGLSEPMVNIRATLDSAVSVGLVTDATRIELLALAKVQYYQSRTWETVLAAAECKAVRAEDVAALRARLPAGSIDQKRLDARELIDAMVCLLETDPAPMQPDFAFEWTEMWANAAWLDERPGTRSVDGGDDFDEQVLNELRLLGPRYFDLQERALLHAFAVGEISAPEMPPDSEDVLKQVDAFRRARGLTRRTDLEAWAAAAGTDMAGFERMMAEEATIRMAAQNNAARLAVRIVDQLRLSGDYERLAARARNKVERLKGRKPLNSPRHLLLERHFQRLDCELPGDIDVYAAELGLPNTGEFQRLLQNEDIYSRMMEEAGEEQ